MDERQMDGGPAFPVPASGIPHKAIHPGIGLCDVIDMPYPGMNLRDYFAAQALIGLLASGIAEQRGQSSEEVAKIAYRNADAMLKARGIPGTLAWGEGSHSPNHGDIQDGW